MAFNTSTGLITITSGTEDLASILDGLTTTFVNRLTSTDFTLYEIKARITINDGATLNIKGKNTFMWDDGSFNGTTRNSAGILIGNTDNGSGGTLVVGESTNLNGETVYNSFETVLMCQPKVSLGYVVDAGFIGIQGANSSCTLQGCTIITNSTIGFQNAETDDGDFIVKNVRMKLPSDENGWQLRMVSEGTIDIDGLELTHGTLFPARQFTQAKDIVLTQGGGLSLNHGGGDCISMNILFEGLVFKDNVKDVGISTHPTAAPEGSTVIIRNGTDQPIKVDGRNDSEGWNYNRHIGTVLMDNDVTIKCIESDGVTNIENSQIYAWDSDSGVRMSSVLADNVNSGDPAQTGQTVEHHFDRDFNHQGTTDADGEYEFIFRKLVFNRSLSNYTSDTNDTTVPSWDSRLPMNLVAWHYGFLVKSLTVTSMTAKYSTDLILDEDVNVTLTEANAGLLSTSISINHSTKTVDITGNVTAEDLYDYIKYDKVNNNITLPTEVTMFTSVVGDTINISDYNLNINNASLTVGSSIIKLVTTQLVTLIGTGSTNLQITDINGTQVSLTINGILTGSIVSIYDNEIIDLGNNNTLLGSTASSGTSFSYSHTGNTNDIVITVIKSGYEEIRLSHTLDATNQTLTLTQKLDTND